MTLAPPAPPTMPVAASVPPPRPGARALAIVMIVVGTCVAAGAVAGTGLSVASALSVTTSERTADVVGVRRLQLDTGAADLRIAFADVDQARLEVTGTHGAGRWTLDRQGDALVVRSGEHDLDGWFSHGDDAVLQLPQALAGLDADLTVDAGDLSLDGTFGALSLDLGAGSADVDVTADSLALLLDAGEADLTLNGVDTVDATVSGGELTGTLYGAQPRSVSVAASAADVELEVPIGFYLLTGDATDGDLVDTNLKSFADAQSTIDAHVSASDVTITASR